MMEENGVVSKANHVGKREILKMKRIAALLLYIFLFQNNLYASNKENISKNLTETNNISF